MVNLENARKKNELLIKDKAELVDECKVAYARGHEFQRVTDIVNHLNRISEFFEDTNAYYKMIRRKSENPNAFETNKEVEFEAKYPDLSEELSSVNENSNILQNKIDKSPESCHRLLVGGPGS